MKHPLESLLTAGGILLMALLSCLLLPAPSLGLVLAQKLVPDLQDGRVALYELLVNTAAAANLIREGKTWQLPGIIQTGQQAGMQNFDQSLAERRAQGRL